MSRQTVLHHHRLLHEALHHAVRWQMVARNAADAVEPPRPTRTEVHVLDPDGVGRLLGGCADSDMHAVVFVALATGARQGELLGLRWADLDLERGSVEIACSLQYVTKRDLIFVEPKTRGSRRRLAISPETVAVLNDHRRRQVERRLSLGRSYEEQGLVFANPVGQPIPPFRLSHRFNTLVKRLGVAPLRFHDFRHTNATLLLKAGVHPKVVSERLGHASVSITLDIYSHVLPGLQEEAAGLLDEYLKQEARNVG